MGVAERRCSITGRAGYGCSCLADAPNSVGRADVKQTTGN